MDKLIHIYAWCSHSLPGWSNGLFCSSSHSPVQGETSARPDREFPNNQRHSPHLGKDAVRLPIRSSSRLALSWQEGTNQMNLWMVLRGFWVKALSHRRLSITHSTCSPQTGFLWESCSYNLSQRLCPFWSASRTLHLQLGHWYNPSYFSKKLLHT